MFTLFHVLTFNSNHVKREYFNFNFFFLINRKLQGHETFLIILNIGTEQETITVNEHFDNVPAYAVVRISSINLLHAEK